MNSSITTLLKYSHICISYGITSSYPKLHTFYFAFCQGSRTRRVCINMLFSKIALLIMYVKRSKSLSGAALFLVVNIKCVSWSCLLFHFANRPTQSKERQHKVGLSSQFTWRASQNGPIFGITHKWYFVTLECKL